MSETELIGFVFFGLVAFITLVTWARGPLRSVHRYFRRWKLRECAFVICPVCEGRGQYEADDGRLGGRTLCEVCGGQKFIKPERALAEMDRLEKLGVRKQQIGMDGLMWAGFVFVAFVVMLVLARLL